MVVFVGFIPFRKQLVCDSYDCTIFTECICRTSFRTISERPLLKLYVRLGWIGEQLDLITTSIFTVKRAELAYFRQASFSNQLYAIF